MPNEPVHLTDQQVDYIVLRVRQQLRNERRWFIGIIATVTAALLGALIGLDGEVNTVAEAVEPLQAAVEPFEGRPYVDEVVHLEDERLRLRGTSFGTEQGEVEVFYKRSQAIPNPDAPSRSDTVTLSGGQVEHWTNTEILLRLTDNQIGIILDRLAAESLREQSLSPYVRVTTSEGRRSPG